MNMKFMTYEQWLKANSGKIKTTEEDCPECDGGGFTVCCYCGCGSVECGVCGGEGVIETDNGRALYEEQKARDGKRLEKFANSEAQEFVPDGLPLFKGIVGC